MRKSHKKQLPLSQPTPDHPKAKEMSEISKILDQNRSIYDLVLQDISHGASDKGAQGMTAEQVVRAAIVKQMANCSYEELEFLLEDSVTFRFFCRFGFQDSFKKSTLNQNIKAISPESWEAINRCLIKFAESEAIEKGRKVRIDCTVVESNIHAPYDSELLWDGVRVLTRLLDTARFEYGFDFEYMNHSRAAKRRNLEITNARHKKERTKKYKALIKLTENTVNYAKMALSNLELSPLSLQEEILKNELSHFISLVEKVIDQAVRRVINKEKVAATDKIFSIFEEHTDIIIKDRRDTYYGHKICLSGGASNLILDCQILAGNPADSTLTKEMLERQKDIYGRPPLKVALDGGFASRKNLEDAKGLGIKDVCFSKGRGMDIKDMCRSEYVYKCLRRFRAGIESGISWLKRAFGLTRCMWRGLESFKSYVWASIVSANLQTLARHRLA
jgi:IS5 family transposase